MHIYYVKRSRTYATLYDKSILVPQKLEKLMCALLLNIPQKPNYTEQHFVDIFLLKHNMLCFNDSNEIKIV